MSAGKRIQQVLMATGLLTILAITAVIGVVAYLWWDTRDVPEYEAAPDDEPGADVDTAVDDGGSGDGADTGTGDTGADTAAH